MSDEDAPKPAGPGLGHVPWAVVVLMSVVAAALAGLTLYTMWAFWPVGADQKSTVVQRVAWFGWHPRVQRELLFFLTVGLAGGLGGLIHTLRSFAWYAGNRELRWSWVPYNALLPVVGALAGTVFYLVLRAGLFSPSTSVQQASPFGFAAIAILAGLFSPQAFEKLRQLAGEIFTKSPQGRNHVDPTNTK
jgi:hypothetical protein